MARLMTWHKEQGARVEGTRDLDRSKVQAPCIARAPEGGFRLFYTAVGPAKPFVDCQGYILSAVSQDGLMFTPEPGIRVAPQPEPRHLSLRARERLEGVLLADEGRPVGLPSSAAPSPKTRSRGGWRRGSGSRRRQISARPAPACCRMAACAFSCSARTLRAPRLSAP